MRLTVDLDEQDIRDILACQVNAQDRGDVGPPAWLLFVIRAVARDIADGFRIKWKAINAAVKDTKLRTMEFDRDGQPRYPNGV